MSNNVTPANCWGLQRAPAHGFVRPAMGTSLDHPACRDVDFARWHRRAGQQGANESVACARRRLCESRRCPGRARQRARPVVSPGCRCRGACECCPVRMRRHRGHRFTSAVDPGRSPTFSFEVVGGAALSRQTPPPGEASASKGQTCRARRFARGIDCERVGRAASARPGLMSCPGLWRLFTPRRVVYARGDQPGRFTSDDRPDDLRERLDGNGPPVREHHRFREEREHGRLRRRWVRA